MMLQAMMGAAGASGPAAPPAGTFANANFSFRSMVNGANSGWNQGWSGASLLINPTNADIPNTSIPGVGNMFIFYWVSTTGTLELWYASASGSPNGAGAFTTLTIKRLSDNVTINSYARASAVFAGTTTISWKWTTAVPGWVAGTDYYASFT